MKRYLRKVLLLRFLLESWRVLHRQYGLTLGWFPGITDCVRFCREFLSYRKLSPQNPHFVVSHDHLYPCLLDRTEFTPVEPVYFIQDTWFANRIAHTRPGKHVDIGSSAKTMALVAQFIPVTIVDIRPVPLTVAGFSFIKGSVTSLPFENASIESLSSLCVLEHIGLGRYGDQPDSWGSEKAWHELLRVLKPGGNLYLSVPVDSVNRVYFNAHRAFTREYVLELSNGLELVHEQYLYGYEVLEKEDKSRGFGTGMYHFKKPLESR